jgi:UDP-3-O-[3-hydroxymyristoyl] N-acetylglucosamine deacetylase
MRLRPAPRDSGIVFFRSDKGIFLNANVNSISDTAFATTLGSNGTRVKTVEHVMAALSGLCIDNVIVEVDGPEVPILDGSSAGFARRILESGIDGQESDMPCLKVIKPVTFKEGKAEISAVPFDGRTITYEIDYDHRLLGQQSMCVDLDKDDFTKELAPARTFGFLKDVKYLKSKGLAKGGSLENAVILSDTGVVNTSGLRFKDEFIRHKILDFIGDMALCGFPIYGHFHVIRSGHTANMNFFKKFLASVDCWQVLTETSQSLKATA